jgi:hypothetical protein
MVAAELIVLALVAVAGGLAIAFWAADRDEHLDGWSEMDILWTLIATSIGGGVALRIWFLAFPFGSVLAAVGILAAWALVLGLATSRRHRTLRRIVALPIGVVVAVRGALQ